MGRITFRCATALACIAGATAPAFAQQGPARFRAYDIDWQVDGANTLRYEYYGVNGDQTAAPYPHEGPQPFNETYMNFIGALSPYEQVRGDISGVLNDSEYRSPDENLVIERANLTWEKGDTQIPTRVEVGDYFGFMSPRVLQRALKGGQADFQPYRMVPGADSSIQVMSGFTNPTWRNIDPDRDRYTGASWVVDHQRLGSYSLNLLNSYREADSIANRGEIGQNVVSIAGERRFTFAGDDVTIEGEVARLMGDVDQASASRFDQTGRGHFLQLRGRSPDSLTYSARYEIYDNDFRPNGAAVSANRRTAELRAGYRFTDPALRLDGRLQQFTDDLQLATSLTTRVAGLALTGAVPERLLANGTFRLDSYLQDSERRDQSIDNLTRVTQLEVNAPIDQQWLGRVGLSVIGTNNQTASDMDTLTRQLLVGASRSFSLLGLSGAFNADLVLRRISGASATIDVGPSIGATLAGGPHAVSATLNTLSSHPNPGVNVATRNLGLAYSYTAGRHSVGSELALFDRDPLNAEDTTAYRIGVFWRVQLGELIAGAFPVQAPEPAGPADEAGGIRSLDRLRLTEIPPGMALADAERRLAAYGLVAPTRLPGALAYDAAIVPAVDQRQRLVVIHSGGRVVRTGLIIDLGALSDAALASDIYARTQEALLRRYGQPSSTFELGQFSPAFEAEVNAAGFVRTTEWRTPQGVLRLGIPRRLDRTVRIEVQLAPNFGSPRDTLWSIESVR